MKKPRTMLYRNLSDDFAGNHIHTKEVDGTFNWEHDGFLWKMTAKLIRYLIGYPVIFLYCKIKFGLKIENRKALKHLHSCCYLYGNHTQNLDVFFTNLATCPKMNYILAGADAVSIRGLKNLVLMLGGIPIPTKFSGMHSFLKTVEKRQKENCFITVYPEAHIWPYYTGIRDFPVTSFCYPAKANLPVAAIVTSYRRGVRTLLGGKPLLTLSISDPIFPSPGMRYREQAQSYRDQIFHFMIQTAKEKNEVEYIAYHPAGPEEEKDVTNGETPQTKSEPQNVLP